MEEFLAPPQAGKMSSLCHDICTVVAEFLLTADRTDVCRLAKTNKQWYRSVVQLPCWEHLFRERYPLSYRMWQTCRRCQGEGSNNSEGGERRRKAIEGDTTVLLEDRRKEAIERAYQQKIFFSGWAGFHAGHPHDSPFVDFHYTPVGPPAAGCTSTPHLAHMLMGVQRDQKSHEDSEAVLWRYSPCRELAGNHRAFSKPIDVKEAEVRAAAADRLNAPEKRGGFISRTFTSLFGGGTAVGLRILMIGPEQVGKTSLLYTWKAGGVCPLSCKVLNQPGGFNVETIPTPVPGGEKNLVIWDLSGRQNLRPTQHHLYHGSDGLIFVVPTIVPSWSSETWEDLASWLHHLCWKVDEFQDGRMPLLILVAGQDQLHANSSSVWQPTKPKRIHRGLVEQPLSERLLNAEEVAEMLRLHELPVAQRWSVQGCSAHEGRGLYEGLRWLATEAAQTRTRWAPTCKSMAPE